MILNNIYFILSDPRHFFLIIDFFDKFHLDITLGLVQFILSAKFIILDYKLLALKF